MDTQILIECFMLIQQSVMIKWTLNLRVSNATNLSSKFMGSFLFGTSSSNDHMKIYWIDSKRWWFNLNAFHQWKNILLQFSFLYSCAAYFKVCFIEYSINILVIHFGIVGAVDFFSQSDSYSWLWNSCTKSKEKQKKSKQLIYEQQGT